MKKSLLFMAFLFIMGGLCASAAETTLNFSDWNFDGASEWGSSYSEHTVKFPQATVVFKSANKQTAGATISNCPVTKGGEISVSFTDVVVSNIKFNLVKWGSKSQTVTLHTSVDGENFTKTTITSSDFTLSSALEEKVCAVKITFSSTSNQVGLKSIDLVYEEKAPAGPVAYEPNFEDVEIWEGNTFALNLGAKHPAEMIFVSSDEAVATVDEAGVITAEGVGTTTISVAWDADANFLASTEDVVFNVTVKEIPEGAAFESVTGTEFNVPKDNAYAEYTYDKSVFATYTTITNNSKLPDIAWNRGNKNKGKDSGVIIAAKEGYYPLKITVESSWASETLNVYYSDKELTLAGLGATDLTVDATITKETSTLDVNGEYKYVGIRPSNTTSTVINKITILWASKKVECPYDAEALTPAHAEGTVALDENGVAVIEIENGDLDGVAIHYMHTPAEAPEAVVRRAVAEGYSEAVLADGVHSITVNAPGSVSYYGYHAASGAKGVERTVTVTPYENTTGIDNVGVDAGEGEVEWFNLQGVKVEVPVAGGLYIRRQGGEVSKVIVK